MNDDLLELLGRFVVAFEKIANTLEGIHEEAKATTKRLWPERGAPREATITRVPNAEDRIREDQGGGDNRPISQWISLDQSEPESNPRFGRREEEFLFQHPELDERRPAGAKTGGQAG